MIREIFQQTLSAFSQSIDAIENYLDSSKSKHTKSKDSYQEDIPLVSAPRLPIWATLLLFASCASSKNDSGADTSVDNTVVDVPDCDEDTYYRDDDADGYGAYTDEAPALSSCSQPVGYVPQGGDCNDSDPQIHMDAEEVCNGLDDNCNSEADEDLAVTYYIDDDGDGYGAESVTTCYPPEENYVGENGDCDDSDASISPNETEVVGDGIDNDCDGYGSGWNQVGCVHSDFDTIQDAIDFGGQYILVCEGTYDEALEIRGKTKNISADGEVIVTGNGNRPLTITDSNVSIDGIDFKNGFSSEPGGGIYVENSDFELNDSSVSGNYSNDDGGGIYIIGKNDEREDNYIKLSSVEITDNYSEGSGGGLYAVDTNRYGFDDCTNLEISRNTSEHSGGGITLQNSSMDYLWVADINDNQANIAGAIFLMENSMISYFWDTDNSITGNSQNQYAAVTLWGDETEMRFGSEMTIGNNDREEDIYILSSGDYFDFSDLPSDYVNCTSDTGNCG